MKGMAAMLCLHGGDGGGEGFEIVDRRLFRRGELAVGSEMLEEDEQRVFDAAELLSVTGDIGKNLFLDRRLSGLPQFDIHQPDLTAHRVEHPVPRVDRLRDIAGKRKAKDGHRLLLSKTARAVPSAITLFSRFSTVLLGDRSFNREPQPTI